MGMGLCNSLNSRGSQLCILVMRAREFPAVLQPVLGQTRSVPTPSDLLGSVMQLFHGTASPLIMDPQLNFGF